MSDFKRYLIYRIYYDDCVVYVGRTKQKLQDRIRGHLFSKPMHRTIDINHVTKIEYSELPTEADMNLYEIYYILKMHPPLNVDDKTKDYPTVTLPELQWELFLTPLWDKWKASLAEKDTEIDKLRKRYAEIPQLIRVVRSLHRTGEIEEADMWEQVETLKKEQKSIESVLYR